MHTAEIIIRTEDPDDGLLIGNAITNGLAKLGFDNITNVISGSEDLPDPELMAAIERINPEIIATPLEVSWERLAPSGSVDSSDDFPAPADDDGPEDGGDD